VSAAILGDEPLRHAAAPSISTVVRRILRHSPPNAPWAPYGDAYNGIVRAIRALNQFPADARRDEGHADRAALHA
jgi:hypothetical protein